MMAKKISLHVGVDKYDTGAFGRGFNYRLEGCVADAKAMNVIAERAGFVPEPPLLDCRVDEFKSALAETVAKIEKGDLFLFTFAGHGAKCESTSIKIKSDGKYEAICLRDGYCWDLEVGFLLNKVPAEATIITIYDCCFGNDPVKLNTGGKPVPSLKSALRKFLGFGPRQRYLRGDGGTDHEHDKLQEMIVRRTEIRERNQLKITAPGYHFAACSREEVAKEEHYAGAGTRGRFSYAFQRAYNDGGNPTYSEMMGRINAYMSTYNDQHPCLKPLFSNNTIGSSNFLFEPSPENPGQVAD